MSDDSTILDRQTLYELVWSKPTAYLANEYGISDVALGKMCHALNVPKPPRGYWAKVRRGHKVVRPPLPPDSTSARTQVAIQPPKARPPRPAPLPAGPDVPVPEQLHHPHPLVARTAVVLKHAKHPRHGIFYPHGESVLRVEVSEPSRARALLIMDALLKAIEQRGHVVAVDDKRETVLAVKGEQLALKLRERMRQSPHVMTDDEQKHFLKYGYKPYTKYDYHPSGVLRLSAVSLDFRLTEKAWSDGRRRLHQQLGTVVVALESFAEQVRQDRLEREETHRRREEEARQREQERRRREEDAKRFEQLRQHASHWREARWLRRYLRAVEAAVPEDQRGPDFENWLAWGREAVERLDPLSRIER